MAINPNDAKVSKAAMKRLQSMAHECTVTIKTFTDEFDEEIMLDFLLRAIAVSQGAEPR